MNAPLETEISSLLGQCSPEELFQILTQIEAETPQTPPQFAPAPPAPPSGPPPANGRRPGGRPVVAASLSSGGQETCALAASTRLEVSGAGTAFMNGIYAFVDNTGYLNMPGYKHSNGRVIVHHFEPYGELPAGWYMGEGDRDAYFVASADKDNVPLRGWQLYRGTYIHKEAIGPAPSIRMLATEETCPLAASTRLEVSGAGTAFMNGIYAFVDDTGYCNLPGFKHSNGRAIVHHCVPYAELPAGWYMGEIDRDAYFVASTDKDNVPLRGWQLYGGTYVHEEAIGPAPNIRMLAIEEQLIPAGQASFTLEDVQRMLAEHSKAVLSEVRQIVAAGQGPPATASLPALQAPGDTLSTGVLAEVLGARDREVEVLEARLAELTGQLQAKDDQVQSLNTDLDQTIREVRHRQLDLEFHQLKLEEKVRTNAEMEQVQRKLAAKVEDASLSASHAVLDVETCRTTPRAVRVQGSLPWTLRKNRPGAGSYM